MSEIGDELRKVADEWDVTPLYALADRIDAEMAELPRGKDGRPIRVGETVYGEDDSAWHVEGVVIGRRTEYTESPVVYATGDSGQWRNLLPWLLTHECPDSWERIADELDDWSEDNRVNGDREVFDRARDFSERIRRLAEREDGNGTD